jgi:hypothetical protein
VPTDAGIEPRTVATGALAVATLVRIPSWGRGISGKALGWEEASFQDLGKILGWGRVHKPTNGFCDYSGLEKLPVYSKGFDFRKTSEGKYIQTSKGMYIPS